MFGVALDYSGYKRYFEKLRTFSVCIDIKNKKKSIKNMSFIIHAMYTTNVEKKSNEIE